MVAGYVNGPYQWRPGDWALFPHAIHVGIAVRAYFNGGDVLDVERGDATPGEAPNWVLMRRASGIDPTVYCSLSEWQNVRDAFTHVHVPEPHYWIAHYDGTFDIPIGAVAKQFENTAGWDQSAVADYWPGIDAAPTTLVKGNHELMERIQVAPSGTTTSVRLRLSGTESAGIIIRPKLNPDGHAVNDVWLGNIFAWGSDRAGIGGNPKTISNYNFQITSHRRISLPGAVWADLEYSSQGAFDIDCF